MPRDISQRGQAAQGNHREATADAHNERTYSNRVNSEASEAYHHHSARSTSNSAAIESGSASNPSSMSSMLAANRTSSAQAYYTMQRWAEETPKEQPWNGLKHIVSSNKKDENGAGK